jgi:hypothetical protein
VRERCVEALEALLPDGGGEFAGDDTVLAGALRELLQVCTELDSGREASSIPRGSDREVSAATPFTSLDTQLTALQDALARRRPLSASRPGTSSLHPAIAVVREELAWARVDSLSSAVRQLVRERSGRCVDENGRTGRLESPTQQWDDALPPDYTYSKRVSMDGEGLPSYSDYAVPALEKPQDIKQGSSSAALSEEKMVRELDAVADAIERLYDIAPQLDDQRVEMRAGPSRLSLHTRMRSQESAVRGQKSKEQELEEIWERIERAHGKRRADQRVDTEALRERRAAKVSQLCE